MLVVAPFLRSIQIADPVMSRTSRKAPTSLTVGIGVGTLLVTSRQKLTEPVSLDETRSAVIMSPGRMKTKSGPSCLTVNPAAVKEVMMLAVRPATVLLGGVVVLKVWVVVP